MRILFFVASLVVLGFVLTGCSRAKTTLIWQGTCGDHQLVFREIQRPRLGMVAISHEIEFDGRTLEVDPSDLWHGKPFEETVYGEATWHLFPDPEERPADDVHQMMLYVPADAMSAEQFQAFSECLASQAASYQPAVVQHRLAGTSYRIAGVVRGQHDDLVERFVKDADSVLEIAPDGSVQFAVKGGVSSGGLADRIEMPGRILRIEMPSVTSLEELKAHKDEKGRSPDELYTIQVAGETSR